MNCVKDCPAYPVCFSKKAGDKCLAVLDRIEKNKLAEKNACLNTSCPANWTNTGCTSFRYKECSFKEVLNKEKDCPFCVGRIGHVCSTCEDCMGSGKIQS